MRKLLAILVLIISIFSVACGSNPTEKKYENAKTKLLTELKDPDSYKMEYYKFDETGGIMKIKFRAKNGFGAMDIGYAYVYFDIDKEKLTFKDSVNELVLHPTEKNVIEEITKFK